MFAPAQFTSPARVKYVNLEWQWDAMNGKKPRANTSAARAKREYSSDFCDSGVWQTALANEVNANVAAAMLSLHA